jgi:hypothetical protein
MAGDRLLDRLLAAEEQELGGHQGAKGHRPGRRPPRGLTASSADPRQGHEGEETRRQRRQAQVPVVDGVCMAGGHQVADGVARQNPGGSEEGRRGTEPHRVGA